MSNSLNQSDGSPNGSYVEWGAVFAGAVLASAISIVLLQFGSGIGLAIAKPVHGQGWALPSHVFATGLWLLWTQITASIGGGYLAGRLRAPYAGSTLHEREIRDGSHGLMTWATGTVAVFIFLSAGAAFAALVTTPADHNTVSQQLLDARKTASVILAFSTAAISLVSGVAAWWAATKGGEHRDEAVDFSHHFSFRKK